MAVLHIALPQPWSPNGSPPTKEVRPNVVVAPADSCPWACAVAGVAICLITVVAPVPIVAIVAITFAAAGHLGLPESLLSVLRPFGQVGLGASALMCICGRRPDNATRFNWRRW